MNRKYLLLFVMALVCAGSSARATITNWPFSDPAQYQVSDASKIEVANGVAKLKLQATEIFHDTTNIYCSFSNGVARNAISIGPDSSVVLQKFGTTYAASGEYTSGVIDGGAGNVWQSIRTRVSNRTGGRSILEIPASTSNMVAIYHLNSDWSDSVSGLSGTSYGNASFTNVAKTGTGAAVFDGASWTDTGRATLLNGLSEATIMFWIKLTTLNNYGGMVAARDAGNRVSGFFQYALSGTIQFSMANNAGAAQIYGSTVLAPGNWYLITGTFKAGDYLKLYVNGQLDASSAAIIPANALLYQSTPFYFGRDPGYGLSRGFLDEVAIFNRALSVTEIQTFYSQASSVGLRVRSGTTPNLSGSFVGPDGQPDSYYMMESMPLTMGGNFSPYQQYLQYQVDFLSDFVTTPYLESVALYGSLGTKVNNTVSDFILGQMTTSTTTTPTNQISPYVGIAKTQNGGYLTTCTFTSRVFDAGAPVSWQQITYEMGAVLPSTISGLTGLWHMDESLADASGAGHNGQPYGIGYTSYAKEGSRSAVFSGAGAYGAFGTVNSSTAIKSVELWVKAANAQDGILELTPAVTLSFSNRLLRVTGVPNSGVATYVNGRQSRYLPPGWNHLVINLPAGVLATNLLLGVAQGDYFEGQMDEMAMYTRTLEPGEISEHYISIRKSVAGRVRLQIRADNVNPLTTTFGALSGSGSYYEDPSGAPLIVGSKRYIQYLAVLDGDGDATPALDRVDLSYVGGTMGDHVTDDFRQGSVGDGTSMLYGDEIDLVDLSATGPANLNVADTSQLLGLWHMDDDTWINGGASVKDASGNGRSGTCLGDATVSHQLQRVGTGCGSFSTNGYVVMGGGALSSNFTVSLWFNTSSTIRSALATTYSIGAPYYALEINGDGSGTLVGALAFVLYDGSSVKVASIAGLGLNDGLWHHVSGVRNTDQAILYIDGIAVAAVNLGSGFGGLGSGQLTLAKYGSQSIFYAGLLDEVVVHGRALSEGEIGMLAASGWNSIGQGTFTGPIIDGGQITYWERLAWQTDGFYGQALSSVDGTMTGLWHLDVLTNGWFVDTSVAGGNDAQAMNGVVVDSSGRFGGSARFDGVSQFIRVPDSIPLHSQQLGVEAWVYLNGGVSRVILDKQSGGTGFQLGIDSFGCPYFKLNGLTCTDPIPLRSQTWDHIAGTYDGQKARLYVNGIMKGSVVVAGSPVTAVDLRIGIDQSGMGAFSGNIDEVAIYNRILGEEEMADHYKAGAVTLKFQARSWTPTPQSDFVGPDGTTNTFFVASTGSGLLNCIGLNQYFQYRAYLSSENAMWTPRLFGIKVDASAYPTDNPWIIPADGFGVTFPGNLTSYSHVMFTNTDASVQYQISGNNGTNWYTWLNGHWEDVTIYNNPTSTWMFSSNKDVINANIGSFYDQLYPKVGGTFKFRAFLKSDAIQQVALDSVTLGYSAGRIVVTIPNGQEVGVDAWLIGVPYTLQWISSGTVGSKLKLEYSLDSGGTWVTIATNVANVVGTNNYSFWTTPGTISDLCRVRVTDMNDATIGDLSDNDFSLTEKFRLLAPNGGEKWYTGRTNVIRWASALNLGLLSLDFAADASNYLYNIAFGLANQTGSTSNQYLWATPTGNPSLLSEAAKIRIRTLGGQGTDYSDNTFMLAGIEITNPTLGSAIKRNSSFNVRWVSAGAGSMLAMDFSMDGGGTWTNVAPSVPNTLGSNTFSWVAAGLPTDLGRLRLRSLSDTNVVGVSAVFTLADIDVQAPTVGDSWLMGMTNVIRWASGGAGNLVNLYYSTNSGGVWTPIAQNFTNASGVNVYNWVVPRFPGSRSQVKVESVQDPGNLWSASPNFNIAGLRVTSPNGGEKWDKDVLTALQWDYQSVGQNGTVQFTYDGGLTYTNIGGPGLGLSDRAYVYTATKPTIRAKVKIIADDPSPFTNVFDESDAYFTVAGITVNVPSNGMSYTIGSTNNIDWISAGSEDPLGEAGVYYTTSGADTNLIGIVLNNQGYPGNNSFSWNIQPGAIPSTTARIIVKSGAYIGRSDVFILRGIKFTTPASGVVYDIGANAPVAWIYAGLDASAVGYIYLSTDGGKTYGATALNESQLWPVQGGGYPWVISSNTDPTTNAVLKFRVTSSSRPEDVGFEAISSPFVIRGMKILTPDQTTSWLLGQTNMVTWLAAQAGPYATLYYSPDGVTYDMTHPVVVNQSLLYGTNSYAWGIELFRLPSTNARIRGVSQQATADSAPFTMRGIRVVSPMNSDIWAVDETNHIAWTTVGTVGSYTISFLKDGTTLIPIAAGVTDNFYDWVVTSNAVSTNVAIIVQDSGGAIGQSDSFKIVGEPAVLITSPVPGDLWKVSQSYTIKWSKGGKMSSNFRIQYSSAPYVTTNEIYNGVVALDPTNNLFSIPWSVPDRLGNTIILVDNLDKPVIKDVSAPFNIVGMFTMASPNGGETNLYALKPTILSWYTRGSVSAVNLYYSTDPLHQTWVLINATPLANNGSGLQDLLTTYQWTVANVESSTARIRVEQANQPGAYDDSDADFMIRYYEIIWHVYDTVTSNNLDSLNVVDSSGWSQADMTSPIVHRYPYGVFNTVWGREYFFNNVIFNWASEPSRVIEVPLARSSVEPDYVVMANFVYDATNAQFRVTSWLQKMGRTSLNPTQCKISIYDTMGNQVLQITSSTPDANGVFWQVIPNTLDKGTVYFAKVEIQFSGATYSSGVTFNLRVPTDAEQAQLMMNALTNIQDIVSRVDTNLTDLATAQAVFRQGAMDKLNSLTNSAEIIKAGLTNLDLKVDLLSTQAITRLDVLTNTIGVIGPGETNLLDLVHALSQKVGTREARILTRPTRVKFGTTLSILYRSIPGATASYQVVGTTDAGGMGPDTGGISEKVLLANWGVGDYQIVCSDISGASDRMIIKVTATELDDLAGTMIGLSNQLAGVELTLATMSVSVSNINSNVGVVTNDLAGMIVSLDSISNVMGHVEGLTNISGSVAALTGAVAQISSLTNMSGQLSFITNMVGSLGSLTNLTPQVASLTNSMAQLQTITNTMNTLAAQMGYLTNVVGQIVILTNINPAVAAMTSAVAQISVLTNMGTQLAYLTNTMGSLSSLTNLTSQMASISNITASTAAQSQYLTNLLTRMGGLTNLAPQMGYLTNAVAQLQGLTNLNDQMAYLTNVIDQIVILTNINPAVAAMTSAVAQISVLTNMGAQLAYLTNAVGSLSSLTNLTPQMAYLTNITAATAGQTQYLTNLLTRMGGLTNLTPQMGYLTNAVAQMQSLTNLNAQMAYLTNVIDQVTALTNMADSVSVMTSAVAQISGLTNMGAQLAYLTNAMGSVQSLTNLTPQVASLTNLLMRMSGLTNLTPQMTSLTNSVGLLMGLTNMPGQLNSMTNIINQLTGLTNISDQVAQMTNSIGQIAGMTNLPSQMNYLTNVISQLTGMTNISAQVAQMTNSIGQIAGMTNLPSQMNYLTNVISQLTGLTNISGQMSQMTNSINQIAGLTNILDQMNYMTNTMAQLGVLTGMVSQVSEITNALTRLSSLTNISDQVGYLTNLLSQMSSLTNIGAQVDVMTNSIGQIAGMTNLSAQMNYLTNIISQLSGITNIGEQVAAMTNSLNQLSGLTNVPDQVGYLTNLLAKMSGLTNIEAQMSALTNISTQVAQMTNSINQIAGMTNLASQMNYLTNVISQLTGMTNISAQVAQMTNSIGQIAGMTNLPAQMSYLTNAMVQLSMMTNSFDQLSGLTNVGAQVSTLTNLNAQMAFLTNAVGALGSLSNEMAGVMTAVGQLGGLTNVGSQVAVLTNSIGQIVALTNMSGQVNALATEMIQLTGTANTISNTLASFTGTMGSLQNVSNSLSTVATMDTSLASMSVVSSNIYTMIENGLGSATDKADAETVFGRIAAIEANVAKVDGEASAAAQRASGARSQANTAASAAQRIKKDMASAGQMGTVMTDVGIIRKSLEDALANINNIPGELSTAEMVKTVQSAQKTISEVTGGGAGGTRVGAGVGSKIEAGSLSDPKAVEALINQLAETKAMMQATRQLMDEAVNKPVVVEWLEGSK